MKLNPVRCACAVILAVVVFEASSLAAIYTVDNTDVPGGDVVGTWVTSSATGGYIGANYFHDNNSGKGTKSITYTPTIAEFGLYTVSVRYTGGSNRTQMAPYTINYFGGSTTIPVDQRTGGGGWVNIGAFVFDAGTAGNVVLSNTGTNDGYVIADAIRFETTYLDTVQLDNPDADRVGAWTSSTSQGGYIGADYQHDGNTGKGTKSATYTPDLHTGGLWQVEVRYTSDANRATNVPVEIHHKNGVTVMEVDQTTGGGTWVVLDIFEFLDGTNSSVVISNTDTDGYVIIDGVRFRQLTSVVPEPATALVTFVLGSAFAMRRRRR